jgi:hypothetical protein
MLDLADSHSGRLQNLHYRHMSLAMLPIAPRCHSKPYTSYYHQLQSNAYSQHGNRTDTSHPHSHRRTDIESSCTGLGRSTH